MRWAYLTFCVILLVSALPAESDAAASARATLDGSDFIVSVDPSDPAQGVLVIRGKVTPSISELRDKLTVTLSSNVTEFGPDGETGRFWHSTVAFDGAAQASSKVMKKGDPASAFTVRLDPTDTDPQLTGDIPVPTGLSMLYWGKLVVTARYSGASEGASSDEADILPEPFYLLNLSLNQKERNVTAGNVLNISFVVKNPANQEETVAIEIPVLEDLLYHGWNVTSSIPDLAILAPGQEMEASVRIIAPETIPYDDDYLFEVRASTLETDPDTSEPGSEAISSFYIHALESDIKGKDPINNGKGNDEEGPSTEQILVAIGVIVLVVVSLFILILFVMKGRGGGRSGSPYDDGTSSPVRM